MRHLVACVLSVALAAPALADSADEAKSGFAGQMSAWNRGDIEGALAFYFNSEDMTWVSRKGVDRGIESFAAAMRADFTGHPELMGVYAGEVLDAHSLGESSALIVVKWSITLDGKRLMGGVSTQLWQRRGKSWQVVLEHAD